MKSEHSVDCCGCGLCEVVCTKNCIERRPAERKTHVFVKGENCLKCGRCDSVCPIKTNLFYKKQKTFLRAISLDQKTVRASASGGIAHELAVVVILNGGIVYGAAWNSTTQRVEHMKALSLEELSAFQGSKYVQSIIEPAIYKDIKEELKKRVVLFIGTPCEVAAVRSYTQNNKNLICVDLICHGVPSPEMLKDQIRLITKNPLIRISFRDCLNFRLRIEDNQGVYESTWEDNPYYSLYMHFASLREYCYCCKFACNTRVGDITIGDYVENGTGYSCVIINTGRGKEWIQKITDKIELQEKDIEILKENYAFNSPTIKHSKTDKFSEIYDKYGLMKAYNKVFMLFKLKRRIRRFIGDRVYDGIKLVLKRHR